MFSTMVLIAVLCVGLVFLGVWMTKIKNDDGGILTLAIILSCTCLGVVLGVVEIQTNPIDSTNVHKAITICDANGGLKSIDQRQAICNNGITLETKTLKDLEKQ